ncbi:peptidoglycan DD-metalloendopeptidase family protein [Streptomyces fulvoviolaceus]|uniref:peptidoglycan DD-metalloendopeptidase family protein n=1 Tax=Streptomyces fulvoviolaceus TaxID=285535 RepID=UPI0021BF75EC|nr:peptidoglycan DD-metalloendopeptidase family protein [Streptomyces fulvoviolaceus]MCT9078792.1 peptidoglycan DD-metalloendopeptidase family protein [Streptomyces fulvoviolaceus]
MAEPTVVGRTRVSITPDTSRVGATLLVELPKAVRPGAEKAGDLIADTITAKVRGAVAKLRPVVKVGLDLDTAATKAALDKLTAARTIKVGVDLDAGAAQRQLDRLTADRKVKVTAELDDQKARTSLDRLTADRTVKVKLDIDESAARGKLDALLGQRTVDILPRIQEQARRTAERQLDRLCADRVVNIRATVDTRVATNEIQNLIRRRVVRIGADVDTRVAADSLANLTRRRQVTVQARADTAGANSSLRFLTRDRTVNVRVRSTGLAALTAGLGSLGGNGGGGGVASLTTRIARLAAVAVTALPSIASLGSAIAQMGPLAVTAAPAVATLIGAFAAIKVGTSGVGDAIKAAFSGTAGEAKAAATATKQVESAQRGLATAQRGVADAQRSLSQANQDARKAQDELSAARRQATRDLADMNAQLRQGALDQKQAALDVQQAEVDLAAVRSDPTATQLQIQQAELALERAKVSAEEQARQQKRLAADTKAANTAGVDGSDVVVQARERIRQAGEQVAEQERNLQDAHRAVADAARQVAQAQQSAAVQTSKLDSALSKLSPNARAFVGTLQAMAPAWRDMKLDVQDRLFSGLGTRLGQVGGQILPTVRRGLVGAAGELNTMGKNALGAVSSLQKAGTLGKVFDGIKSSLGNLNRVPGQLITGFAQLSVAAQPAFDRITKGAGSAMDRVMDKLGKAFEDGRLEKAISTALDVAVQFGGVLADLGGIFAGIFKAAGAAGGDFFGVIGAALKEIRRVIELPEIQAALTQIFKALNAVAKLVAGALGAALQAILPLAAAVAPVIVQLADMLGPVVAQLLGGLGKALMPIIEALLPIVGQVMTVLADLAVMLLPILQPIGELIAAILAAVAPLIAVIGENLKTFFGAFIQILTPVIMALIPAVQMFGDLFAQLAPLFPPLYQALLPLIPPLTQLALSLLTLALQVITPFMPLITTLAGLFTTVLAGAVSFLVPIITTVIGWITALVDGITSAIKWIADKFTWLFDFLLGHSIIPDIVKGALSWFTGMFKGLIKIVTSIKDGIVDRFNKLKDAAVRIWDVFWGKVRSIASGAWKLVRKGWDTFVDALTGSFDTAVKGLGKIWGGIQKIVKAPIKFWIEVVYNKGIVPVWNKTASKIPGIPDLPKMSMPKGFARGGILPGWSTWRDGDDQLVPMRRGEGVYVSEVMADPYERARLHALNAAAVRGTNPAIARAQYGFAEGGILGAISDVGSGIASGVGSVLKKGADVVRGELADLAASAFKPVKKGIAKALGSNKNTYPGMIGAAPIGFIDKAIDWIRGKDTPASTGQWIKPVNAAYGTRFGVKGSMWSSGRHTGLDFPAKTGTKIVAVDNGTVSKVQTGGPYGKHVTVNHGGGLASLYAHMSSMAAKAGASISQGGRIGAVGATGNVTGPHLHLEARVNGKSVDPMKYLTGGGDGGSGVQRWRGVVQQALGQVHQSLSLANTTLRRMNQESGGNPKAVNRTDSNWKAGHPSVGLMQVIEGTFKAYAGKYKNTGPKLYGVSVDPMANIYASMRYALARYGSLSKAYNRPGGYAGGGIVGTRIHRGPGRGYASGGIIKVGGKRIDTGPLAATVGADFLKQLAGTASAISTAMTKVAAAVKNAFKGVKTTLDNKLLAQIGATSKRLQELAKQRDAIAAKIAAANQLAADATGQAVSFTALTSLPNGGNTFDATGILSGLNVRLGQLKAFGKNLQILGERGLSKTLLQQIISAGPDSGAAYAQALVDATPSQLKDINATQDAINKATSSFGKDAADSMYDAGANSGKGYLTGLTSTQKLIEEQMKKIAKAIQKTITVELKIKSPSRILEALGRFTGLGFAKGVGGTVPDATAAARRMAGAVRSTATATAARIQQQSTVNNGGDRNLNYHATVREVATRKSILDALAMEDMLNRTVVV